MKKIVFIYSVLLLIFISGTQSYCQTDSATILKTDTARFDVSVATQKYLDTLTPEQKSKSDAYFEGGYWLTLWQFAIDILIAVIFLTFGLSKRLSGFAGRAKRTGISNLMYIMMYLLITYLLTFPFTVYAGFFREHKYGLSNMTFMGWFSEQLISLVLMMVLGSVLIMIIYMVLRKTGERWWIWGSGVALIFMIFLLFISPVFISPLFNKYKPLEDGPVKEKILSLARANGVPVENVYQFDASKQSKRISANVSGIGSVIRISLNDNLLNNCTLPEIKAVMAHELGHYVLNHTYKLLIYLGIIMAIGFAFVNCLMKRLIARFGDSWGIKNISDITGLPLLSVLFSLFIFIANPVINNISRSNEVEADIFGLNAAREPDGFASVSMKLSDYRKINPGKLEEIVFYDHPSGKARVLSAMKWKAENLTVPENPAR